VIYHNIPRVLSYVTFCVSVRCSNLQCHSTLQGRNGDLLATTGILVVTRD